jgi:K+ transporter
VGGIFAPVIAIWLALNAGSGIYNIISFPGIFRGEHQFMIRRNGADERW